MNLKLHFTETAVHPIAAAYIAGGAPDTWMKEIDRWGLPPASLRCYALPVSRKSVEAAGLLVVFENPETAGQLDLKDPYAVVGDKMYIPLHAVIQPEVSDTEWHTLLNWPVQVFHPIIGLVGFYETDRLDLSALFTLSPAVESDWNLAQSGIRPRPPLQQIKVLRPTPEELLNSLKDEIQTKPLSDIPKKEGDERNSLEQVADDIQSGLLKGTLSALERLGEALNEKGAKDGKGWLNRLHQSLLNKLEEIERRRKNELDRLVRMFDENMDEALKYAIPLDNTYQHRGEALPSWKLSRRTPDFNLGSIGGGKAKDAWDAGEHFNHLRTRYQKAAQDAIGRGDFRKAAYIHAHLLGDFHSAANVLKQGKHYREAAILYKDHLKNIPAAAQCLEQGGLYLEAIELYVELKKYETVGDLYTRIGQDTAAVPFYEKCLDVMRADGDYLEVARIAKDKLQQTERAKTALLEGWQGTRKPEICLQTYAEWNMDNEQAGPDLREVFERLTPLGKRASFLNVLVSLQARRLPEAVGEETRNMAYEIISQSATKGNLSQMSVLNKFLPEDRLLAGDCSRFVLGDQQVKSMKPQTPAIHLQEDIQWLGATTYRNQFLALGAKGDRMHLARGNWYGHVEYYAWAEQIGEYPKPRFMLNQYASPDIYFYGRFGQWFETKNLPRNKHFDAELRIGRPQWLPPNNPPLVIKDTLNTVMLLVKKGLPALQFYTLQGNLSNTILCADDLPDAFSNIVDGPVTQMHYYAGSFFVARDHFILQFREDGTRQVYASDWRIRQLCSLEVADTLHLVALTDNGCILLRPVGNFEDVQMQAFANNFTPVDALFIGSGQFLVAKTSGEVLVYSIDAEGASYQKTIELEPGTLPVALLAGALHNQFAVLEMSGAMRVYAV